MSAGARDRTLWLPDELLVNILVIANCPRASVQVCKRWMCLVVARWSAFFWMDPYYPGQKGSPWIVPNMTLADCPLRVTRAMLAILNERPPLRTELSLKKGKIEKLLWNEQALMFEASCERGVVCGQVTAENVVLCPLRAEGTWTEIETRPRMQAEAGGDPPRMITVDGQTYDFERNRGVYGGWLRHERLFFLTKSKDGIQFERVYKGDHSILRPRYQPSHIIITNHLVLYFFKEGGARLFYIQYR